MLPLVKTTTKPNYNIIASVGTLYLTLVGDKHLTPHMLPPHMLPPHMLPPYLWGVSVVPIMGVSFVFP